MNDNYDVIDIDWSLLALIQLLNKYEFNTVLDVGSGKGLHTKILRLAGKTVTSIDKYVAEAEIKIDLLDLDTEEKFDCIFCSHVVEHQRNCGLFLDKIHSLLKDDGILCIVGPNHSDNVLIEGHLKTWTAAIALQNLTLAGFDCSDAFIYQFHETGIICKKSLIFETVTASWVFLNNHLWPAGLPKVMKLSNEDNQYLSHPIDAVISIGKDHSARIEEVKIHMASQDLNPFVVKSSRFFAEQFKFVS